MTAKKLDQPEPSRAVTRAVEQARARGWNTYQIAREGISR